MQCLYKYIRYIYTQKASILLVEFSQDQTCKKLLERLLAIVHNGYAVVFWHAVRETLSKHEVERYTMLKHVINDTGRGRAWLRSSLNEKSLEKQMNGLKSNTKLVR